MTKKSYPKQPENATGVVVFDDGTIVWGKGFGAEIQSIGEICFNTGLTGYQETLTDPSFAAQIITFTFPHIGNVGTNDDDMECVTPAARGLIVREDITEPASWRAQKHLDGWLKEHNLPGICGVDTRAITRRIRDKGAQNGVIAYSPDGKFDIPALQKAAKDWGGLEGMDLAKEVTTDKEYDWSETCWDIKDGYGELKSPTHKVVAIDYGAKKNILRCLANAGCDVTVVPATASIEDIMKHKPDGVFLSNGPGDPMATAEYAVPVLKALLEKNIPIFGICLGHQLLSQALGAETRKMHLGHRGANQPVKDLETGKVEITSQNHGFEVVEDSLPDNVVATHRSLFDGSNEGIKSLDKKAFSVQYHPEASPGPNDSYYLFERFVDMMKAA
ncbi:glutamine-hydrolyzing carbamoyl-phosphate synthase small subunit [Alphaproteobacteria bacterium]|nr:glutamine-hydrolyzing carbamoyl-phosphate synthase small subunit [Alphaproteobacteria bacterium]